MRTVSDAPSPAGRRFLATPNRISCRPSPDVRMSLHGEYLRRPLSLRSGLVLIAVQFRQIRVSAPAFWDRIEPPRARRVGERSARTARRAKQTRSAGRCEYPTPAARACRQRHSARRGSRDLDRLGSQCVRSHAPR